MENVETFVLSILRPRAKILVLKIELVELFYSWLFSLLKYHAILIQSLGNILFSTDEPQISNLVEILIVFNIHTNDYCIFSKNMLKKLKQLTIPKILDCITCSDIVWRVKINFNENLYVLLIDLEQDIVKW